MKYLSPKIIFILSQSINKADCRVAKHWPQCSSEPTVFIAPRMLGTISWEPWPRQCELNCAIDTSNDDLYPIFLDLWSHGDHAPRPSFILQKNKLFETYCADSGDLIRLTLA